MRPNLQSSRLPSESFYFSDTRARFTWLLTVQAGFLCAFIQVPTADRSAQQDLSDCWEPWRWGWGRGSRWEWLDWWLLLGGNRKGLLRAQLGSSAQETRLCFVISSQAAPERSLERWSSHERNHGLKNLTEQEIEGGKMALESNLTVQEEATGALARQQE